MGEQKHTKTGTFTRVMRKELWREEDLHMQNINSVAQEEQAREKQDAAYKKMIRSTAVCAAIAIGIWALSSIDTGVTNTISNGISQMTGSELLMEEDLGRLKFVSTDPLKTEDASQVFSEGYSLPMNGEVVSAFSDTGKNSSIAGEKNEAVVSVLSGTVCAVGENSITISNENGSKTTYQGVVPSVKAGDIVKNSQIIGSLQEEILTVETVSGIGYIDSLSASALQEMMPE